MRNALSEMRVMKRKLPVCFLGRYVLVVLWVMAALSSAGMVLKGAPNN